MAWGLVSSPGRNWGTMNRSYKKNKAHKSTSMHNGWISLFIIFLKFTICLQLVLSVFNKIKRCTRPLCAQVVKMWSWVFIVTVLLPFIKRAEAQGINNSLSPPNYHNSCVSLCTENISLCVYMFSPSLVLADRCNNVQAADIVFLIDGSSSIGRANFLQVKGFMAGIIKPFASSVSESGIRFGTIQYSDTSRWLAGLIFA